MKQATKPPVFEVCRSKNPAKTAVLSGERLLFFFAIPLMLGIILAALVLSSLNWLVLESSVRAKKVTKNYVELSGVALQFVAAVIQEWEVVHEHFADARGLRSDDAVLDDERIIPSVNDVYRAKS